MFKRTVVLSLLQLVSLLIFCVGFFPQKKVLKGEADFIIEEEFQIRSKPVFDKFVLVIVDALRSDFVFDKSNSNFSFVHSLLNDGNAWGYTAYSNPPTVTLPRLKGITTGSTPNFLDAILNVAEDDSSTNLSEQDSWLRQLYKRDRKMRFFGDDTWLKLFPQDYFKQHDGTNSFFVSDFEQVDFNVTRHLPEQLAHQDEWDVLILHYLGLDHIGHKGGPRSQFMLPKQTEMDDIIKTLYENVDDGTLICLMGDHGMNDVGNHGGSSQGETSAAMVLISKELKNYELPSKQKNVQLPIVSNNDDSYEYLTYIQQVDFVPTLAALLNIPIPRNSVGILIPDILQLLDPKLAIIKLQENYYQLKSLLGENFSDIMDLKIEDINNIIGNMRDMQQDLTRSATNYNYFFLNLGLCSLSFITIIGIIIAYKTIKPIPVFLLISLISIVLGFSSFGSSMVEEEHQIWWFIICGLLVLSLLVVPNKTMLHISIFVCVRIIRGWNNSGQKYIHKNVTSELLRQNPKIEWYLNLLSIFVVGLESSFYDPLAFVSAFILSTLCFIYKVGWAVVNREDVPQWMYKFASDSCSTFLPKNQESGTIKNALVPLAQLFFQTCAILTSIRMVGIRLKFSKRHALKEITRYVSILMIFQSPTTNIGLFLVFHILKKLLTSLIVSSYNSNVFVITILSLALQYFTFFQFGGTNSIATVDLSNAYNGVSENYNIYFVGFMMCVSNFAPTIYWSAFKFSLLYSSRQKSVNNYFDAKLVSFVFYGLAGTCLLAACYLLRFHLFIWSVFSPKLCYFATWNIFMNLIISWIFELMII